MNDFLQSIRNQSKDKRYQSNNRPRRPYDNTNSNNNGNQPNHHNNQQSHHNNQQQNQGNYHRNNDNYRNNDSRKFQQRPRNDTDPRDENLGMIKELLETMVSQQGQTMEIHERRAIAEERKADAIEEIASVISALAGAEFPAMDKVVSNMDSVVREFEKEPAVEDAAPLQLDAEVDAPASLELSKTEIIAMIHKMRGEGATYNEVADHLTGMGLATFSGRGKWHAQTIHRLCQQD